MSKRFTDNDIWDKKWFMDLSPLEKAAWFYIKDRCDSVGVWDINTKLADCYLGDNVEWDEFFSKCNGNIVILGSDKLWLVDFCTFQYGTLSTESKPHRAYIAKLEKHGLLGYFELSDNGYTLSIPLDKGLITLQEKEKDKEKEKEKDKEKEPSIEAVNCASLLFTLHRDNIDQKYDVSDARVKKWAVDIERINRLDGRSWQEIEGVIRWVKRPGEFWAPNIMSGSKLREKFPQVVAKMSANGNSSGNGQGLRNGALSDKYKFEVNGEI